VDRQWGKKCLSLYILSHVKKVMTILKLLIERLGKTQIWLAEETHIHKNRISDLVNGRDYPKPDEIVAIDKALKQNRRLVHEYCSDNCPAGKYAGYRFSDMDMQTAGIRLISNLATMDRLVPEIAEMLCEGRLTPEMLSKLSQLRLAIMALEVRFGTVGKASSKDIICLKEFVEKRKATCALTQMTLGVK